ncbi:MAG: MATE family efflux transporter [Akkermansiaceae bacterium]|nr:MATE family efflux transporter [Akkermansiaceae bacterium]
MAGDQKLEELEKRSIWPLLVSYSLPAIVGMVAMSVYNLVDSVYVGRWCGAFAIAAMAIVFPIMNLMVAVGTLVGLGSAATASICLGQGKRARAERVLGHCVKMGLVLGVLVGWLPLPWLEDILRLFGATENTLAGAYDFMLVLMLGFPLSSSFMNLNHVMRASGYPKRAMVSLLISMVVNVAAAPVFIYVLDWGLSGAALATTLAQLVGMVWVLRHYMDKQSVLHFRWGIYRLRWPLVRRICSVGMPPCLLNICGCVVVVFFNFRFMQYDGDMGVAAYGVVNRVVFFFAMIVLGITQGLQPIAGYNLGLGRYSRVRLVLFYAMAWATCITALGALSMELFPRSIVSIFARESDANAAMLVELATRGVRLLGICFALVGSQMVIGNFFQAIGRPVLSIFLNLTRQLLLLIPALCLLPGWLGEPGIWLSQTVADFLSSCIGFTVLYLFFRHSLPKKDLTPDDPFS